MDELLDLDVQCGEGAGSSSSGVGSSLSVPRSKRRKTLSRSPPPRAKMVDATLCAPQEVSAVGTDDEADPSPTSLSKAGSLDLLLDCPTSARDPSCTGCNRTLKTGRHWVSNERVVWAHPNGRGLWCRDCHNLWRLQHSDMSLLLFGQWLAEYVNRQHWEIGLLSYISLLVEGHIRIQKETLCTRIDLLLWLQRNACIPLRLSTVVPLCQLVKNGTLPADPDPTLLTTTMVGGVRRLAMHQPSRLEDAPLQLERPSKHEQSSVLTSRLWLASDCDEDAALLQQVFGGNDSLQIKTKGAMDKDDVANDNSTHTKLDNTIESACKDLRGVMREFGTDTWELLKESSLTSRLSKMSALLSRAEGSGDEDSVKLAQAWCKGLLAAKTFAGKRREFEKAKCRNNRLVDMFPCLEDLVSFIVDFLEMDVALGMMLLRYKVLFWKEVNESKAMQQAVQLILAKGFDDFLGGLSNTRQKQSCDAKPEYWLRNLLVHALVMILSSLDHGAVDGYIEPHLEDCLQALEALRNHDNLRRTCGSAIEDFENYIVILQSLASPDVVQATKLKAALQRVEDEPSMAVLKAELYNGSVVSKNILSSAASLMQVSAKDVIGDDKMRESITYVDDVNLCLMCLYDAPDLSQPHVVVKNLSVLLDLSAVDMLDDSLRCVVESLGLWSKVHLEQQAGRIKIWLERIDVHVSHIDDMLSLVVTGIIRHASTEAAFRSSKSGNEMDEGRAVLGAPSIDVATLKDLVSTYGIQEEPFLDFLGRYIEVVEKIDDAFQMRVTTAETKTLIAQCTANTKIRDTVSKIVNIVGQFDHISPDAKDAVEEWKRKKQHLAKSPSFLVSGSRLIQAVDSLDGKSLAIHKADLESECILSTDEEGSTGGLVGSFKTAKTVCTDIQTSQIYDHTKQVLIGSVDVALREFGSSLCLGGIRQDAKSLLADAGEISLAQTLDCLVDQALLVDNIKLAAKHFGSGRSSVPWTQQALGDLVVELRRVLPADIPVTMEGLCRSGHPVSQWTDPAKIQELCSLFSTLSQMATTVAYLRDRCFSASDVGIKQKVRPEICAAISVAKFTSTLLMEKLRSSFVQSQEVRGEPWLVGIAAVQEWAGIVVECIPRLGLDVLIHGVAGAITLSQELEKVTPRYDHIVSDSKFSKQLAARHLLKWPSRSTLAEKAKALFQVIADLQRLQTTWSIVPTLEDGESTKDDWELVQARFGNGKNAITIIAAAEVLLVKSDNQLQNARTLVDTKKDILPKALLTDIEKLLAQQPSSGRGKKAHGLEHLELTAL